jgi:lysophospholipase L1-like esterase
MAFSDTLDFRPNDVLGIIGTSYTVGNAGAFPVKEAKWHLPARNTIEAQFACNGIDNSGMRVKGINTYRRAPIWIQGGLAGETIAGATAQFFARVGRYNPTGLIIELGENDNAAAITANGPALITAVKDPNNYAAKRVTPRWAVWMCTMWRGSEQWNPPDPTIPARNAAIQALLVGANSDIKFIGEQYDLWLAEAPARNPAGAVGFYTSDNTHPTGDGGDHGPLGSEVISRGFVSRFTYVFT